MIYIFGLFGIMKRIYWVVLQFVYLVYLFVVSIVSYRIYDSYLFIHFCYILVLLAIVGACCYYHLVVDAASW